MFRRLRDQDPDQPIRDQLIRSAARRVKALRHHAQVRQQAELLIFGAWLKQLTHGANLPAAPPKFKAIRRCDAIYLL